MWQGMEISIREFKKTDIPQKVEWINNPENNKYLHYDLPLCVEKTEKWFDSHSEDDTRYDAVIVADDMPVGTIGLLNIDKKNSKAEYYIAMGVISYKGKGVAKAASQLILKHGFEVLGLNRIYLFTEEGNIAAQKLFESVGFVKEGLIRQDIASHGYYVNRFVYAYLREDWLR